MNADVELQRGWILKSLGPSITHKQDISNSRFCVLSQVPQSIQQIPVRRKHKKQIGKIIIYISLWNPSYLFQVFNRMENDKRLLNAQPAKGVFYSKIFLVTNVQELPHETTRKIPKNTKLSFFNDPLTENKHNILKIEASLHTKNTLKFTDDFNSFQI